MNYQIIYDITQQDYNMTESGSMIALFIALILLGGAVGIAYDRYKKREYSGVLSSLAFMMFVLYASFVPIGDINRDGSRHEKLVTLAKSQACKKVEGKVKNFQRMSVNRKKPEHFEIDGVKFHYNAAMLTGAFNQPNSPIKDGLLVRISYVYDKNWNMNLILKLEVAE